MSDLITKEPVSTLAQSTQQTQPQQLIQLAIQSGADVDKLERLLDMQERWERRESEKAFNAAMAKFQSECPRIVKSKQAHGYKYAPLGDIQAQIKDKARECGLSWRWETKDQSKEQVTVSCIITHIDGFSRSTDSIAFIDEPNKMQSRTQMIGVATTYAQRYSLIGALGLSTADDDMDGRLPQEFRDKPAYTKFKEHKEAMTQAFKQGRSADDVITNLENEFKVTETVKAAIRKLEETTKGEQE